MVMVRPKECGKHRYLHEVVSCHHVEVQDQQDKKLQQHEVSQIKRHTQGTPHGTVFMRTPTLISFLGVFLHLSSAQLHLALIKDDSIEYWFARVLGSFSLCG